MWSGMADIRKKQDDFGHAMSLGCDCAWQNTGEWTVGTI